jgi:hypothetical protein
LSDGLVPDLFGPINVLISAAAAVVTTISAPAPAPDNESDNDPEDFTEEGLKAREAVLGVSKSVVCLAASIGNLLLSLRIADVQCIASHVSNLPS